MPRNIIDKSDQRFGKLLVMNRVENSKKGGAMWRCVCDCGNTTIVLTDNLKIGGTSSCGCNVKKHGLCHTKEYTIWENIVQRCTNIKHPKYPSYGARGITVCDRWLDFKNFYEDMGARPSDDYSLDRIDNNLGYSKDNCRWATRKEQQNNTRRNRYITYQGETKTIPQWAEIVGISIMTLRTRLFKLGWDTERALTTPIKVN